MKVILICTFTFLTSVLSAEIGFANYGRLLGRIANGKDAKPGEVPYIVSYQQNNSGRFEHTCGGAIISPTHILTAAHCIVYIAKDATSKIIAGTAQLNNTLNKDRQDIIVVERIVHPSYRPSGTGPNDIAILRLEKPLKITSFVKIINLPRQGTEAKGNVVLSGWGWIRPLVWTNYLQTLTLPLIPNAECFEISKKFAKGNKKNPYSLQANICTLSPPSVGYGPCSGDSGGPLVQNGTLLGIVSWGESVCGLKNAISVYGKVENFISFIRQNVPDLSK